MILNDVSDDSGELYYVKLAIVKIGSHYLEIRYIKSSIRHYTGPISYELENENHVLSCIILELFQW